MGCLFILFPLIEANASIDLGDPASDSGTDSMMTAPAAPVIPAGSTNAATVAVITNTSPDKVLAMPGGNGSKLILTEEEKNNFANLEGLNKKADLNGALNISSPMSNKAAVVLPASDALLNSPVTSGNPPTSLPQQELDDINVYYDAPTMPH